jgi:hypothetical protein
MNALQLLQFSGLLVLWAQVHHKASSNPVEYMVSYSVNSTYSLGPVSAS